MLFVNCVTSWFGREVAAQEEGWAAQCSVPVPQEGTWSVGRAGWLTAVVLTVLWLVLMRDRRVLWGLLLIPEAFPCAAPVAGLGRGFPSLLAVQLHSGS